jgi:meso-butanediol dehydrogenase/(S,S)-butanediol dehydrogenase/diacetyl reductase
MVNADLTHDFRMNDRAHHEAEAPPEQADVSGRDHKPESFGRHAESRVGNVLDCDPENWKNVMSVNLDGTFLTCQAFARAVQQDKTSRAIVNISSGAGIMGVPNRLPYLASKFAVSGITRTMGAELGPYGIRVNAIAPGMIRTPFTANMFDDPEKAKRIRAAHAICREGQPEEITAVAAVLLTDDASFMTGGIVSVDGGQTACIPSV